MLKTLRPIVFLVLSLCSVSAQERYDLRLTVTGKPVAAPMTTLTSGPEMACGVDGTVAMLWSERRSDGLTSLRVAYFLEDSGVWSTPLAVAKGRNLASADAGGEPRLAIGQGGRMAAVWTEERGGNAGANLCAMIAISTDAGRRWTAPQHISDTRTSTGWPSIAAKPDGGWSVAWISQGGEKREKWNLWLETTFAGAAKPVIVAAPVSLSQPVLADFADGSSLVGFRDQADDGARDPWTVRREEDGVMTPVRVGRENWREKPSPVPGMRFSTSGPLVAASWFTASGGDPRILCSMTPDGGCRWTTAQRCDLGRAVGPTDVAILRDGTQLVLWLENPGDDPSLPGGYYLRRYGPNGASAMPARLAALATGTNPGSVRLVVLRDRKGARTELLALWAESGPSGRHVLRCRTLLLPTAAQLEGLDSTCKCGPGSLPGYPVRGRILTVDANHATLTIHHNPVPGLFRAGDLAVKVDPALLKGLTPGREFLGRMDERRGIWWLSDLRLFE